MTPQPSIAHFRILSKLGEGGMGEVWRATDTKLGREVAIKILPEAFAADPDRLARFTREAQVLASLNHPNIAAIYGVEDRALIMELVEGEAPAGPLSAEEALPVVQQFIDALEYAHDRGIVHRDLKPANLKLTPDRRLKVLDFGLAKALSPDAAAASDPASSPTLTMRATQLGMIVGTAAYMSPEQARGHAVDKRADIWSFGVVLYELLTGRQLFAGETVSDILAAVLTRDSDLSAVPPRFQRLLRLCLTRDPRQRLRDISGARLLLDEPAPPLSSAPQPAARARPWGLIAAALLALAVAALLAVPKQTPAPALRPLLRFETGDPAANLVAVSPDGSRIVYSRSLGESLMTRRLDEPEAHSLAGTESAFNPEFSPDGQWVTFWAASKLRKIPLAGGPPVVICDAPAVGVGVAWGDDGNIVFSTSVRAPLSRVSASGGKPESVTAFDSARGEITHRRPFLLPGAHILLFTADSHGGNYDDADVIGQNLQTGRRAVLHHGGFGPSYATGPSGEGYLLFFRGNTLFAMPFDPGKLQVREPAIPVLEGVSTSRTGGVTSFALSAAGVAAYRPGNNSDLNTIQWIDASGHTRPLPLPPAIYSNLRVSPDGKRVLYRLAREDGADLWIYETETGNISRLTSSGHVTGAAWAPGGRHILYLDANGSLHWIRSDGSGQPRPIAIGAAINGFTLAGNNLLAEADLPGGRAIAAIALPDPDSDDPHPGTPKMILPVRANEQSPAVSPDGHWLAYRSDESGRAEIYVRPFPSLDGKWQVSQGGGSFPAWSSRGELFFLGGARTLMAVSYSKEQNTFRHAAPRTWYTGNLGFASSGSTYSLTPDGTGIVAQFRTETAEQQNHPSLIVLVNFLDEIERKVRSAGK
jgi:hypothetical protein